MAKPMKDMKEPAGAKLSKFRVGYSVKWNFNGILEVEAASADDAEKTAQSLLEEKAEHGDFGDVSEFKAEFDDVNVLDTEEVKDDDEGEIVKGGLEHAEECRYARNIAGLSTKDLDGDAAAKAVAEAIVMCKAHPVTCMGDGLISFDYDNSFGPTTTVDDVLERMNMRDWRMACDWFCKLMLRKGGLDPENFDWPTPFPKVMKVPEDEGTDVISRVCVTFKVDDNTYGRILEIVDAEDKATGEEICSCCDTVIRYAIEPGKRVVVCPECGAINPLCNECEPDSKRCSECKISKMCEELNKMRTNAVRKEE